MPTCTFDVSGDDELIVPVIIANPNTARQLTVEAVIDTGATTTQIETHIAKRLDLPFHDFEEIRSIYSSMQCNSYFANIAFESQDGIIMNLGEYRIVDGLDTTVECLIARDILHNGLLIYNGINSYFTLSF